MNRSPRARRTVLAAALLLTGLTVGPLAAGTASAHTAVCRSDPMFYLSNGSRLDVSATINSQASDVRLVSYTVHVPAGVTISRVVYTGGQFTKKESVHVLTDDLAGTYDTDTLVSTKTSNVAVTASTYVQSMLATYAVRATGTASGNNDQHLAIHLNG